MSETVSQLERKAFDPVYRLRRLNDVRRTLDLATLELDAQPLGTSVGIEIEMTWPQAFPDMSRWDKPDIRPRQLDRESAEYEQFSLDFDRNERKLLPKLKQIESVIPRVGRDAYWEFSFLPTKNVGILIAEVSTLFESGILRDDQMYATHLTLSGIDNDRDAYAALMLLELEGSTPSKRLTDMTGWARKGTGGMRKRHKYELLGDDEHAYEFRTLVTQSVEQVTQLLNTAQSITAMMHDSPDEWLNVRRELEQILRVEGLPLKVWPQPSQDPGLWLRYAQLLDTMQSPLSHETRDLPVSHR